MTSTPQPGLLLRLSGPLQSWGERSHFNERDTAAFPTRSGVIGLIAAAMGRHRGQPLDDITQLSIVIRADRPGLLLRDLHTVGGGLPPKDTVTTAEGKKRSGDTTTLLTHRTYLADAAFTLALTTPHGNATLLEKVAVALAAPHWPPYLGRRSCPPEGPLLLGHFDDVLHHLTHLPLAAPRPRTSTRGVAFLADQPLHSLRPPDGAQADSTSGAHPVGQVNDQPLTFHPRHRAYQARPLYRRTIHLPADQHTGLGTDHLNTLATYLTRHQAEGSTR
ncbi:type I-E CRISPR-associated protein Cas5/CasD [Streptomyces yokosukanensis]|uniref:Type I-E CRISPR-associated protein Cas5/CasD n=1 Tax=Streptomyces yokosukanensis TaxID=67386 RepID=A0A101NWX5_9ACTN|nr:type I-E CRISPR-associated protein Cas5/CasD [Streptomyces yokosukanensis]KUN00768.1 type I-E CRISPR-associated protein Cas5/CasD [Streptomyces yokosukanensis]